MFNTTHRSLIKQYSRTALSLTLLITSTITTSHAQEAQRDDTHWQATLEAASGQTVYFNAWGGSPAINRYLEWSAEQLASTYDITLEHVKVNDIAITVQRIQNEKQAKVATDAGKVDLMWINGENFAAMKDNDLLSAPFTDELPNFSLVDTTDKPTTLIDFGIPTNGLESPWGMAQLTFYYDSQYVDAPPKSMAGLAKLAADQPGRITYAAPPAFIGTTFLKQALYELTDNPDALLSPVSNADFEAVTAPLWSYLDALHPQLWRAGDIFAKDGAQLRQLVNNSELILGMTFNPNEAARAVNNGELPASIRSYQHTEGTVGNTHFVAIPYNAQAKPAAKVVANFFLSPEAQARKADITHWGDPTVLDIDALNETEQALFHDTSDNPARLSSGATRPVLPELHPSWVPMLEQAWLDRYQ